MNKQPVLWVLVADGCRARVVVPDLSEGHFRTLLPLGTAEHPHGPPRLRDEAGERPHSFAAEVAERVSEEARMGSFNQLVLVGPGHVVHDLREHLTRQAAGFVVGTVMHDYSRLNDHDLSPHLAQWWMTPAELV